MERSVIKSGMRRIQRYELGRENREKRGGMQAIGLILILINPSWILFAKMERLLPLFAERLGNGEKYQYQCETMVGE